MTIRIREKTRPAAVTYRIGSPPNYVLGSPTTLTYPNSKIGVKEYIDSVDTGRFIPGIVRINPVVISRTTVSCDPCTMTSPKDPGAGYQVLSGDISAVYCAQSWPSNDGSDWSTLYSELSRNRAMAKFSSPDWDVGAEIGELTETLSMLRHPLTGIVEFINRWRKSCYRSPKYKFMDTMDMLTSTWMEYRYGLMPLIYSAQDIFKLMTKGSLKTSASLSRLSASAKGVDYTTGTPNNSGILGLSNVWRKDTELKIRYNTKIYFRYNQNLDWLTALKALGLDPLGFASLAWELTSLSFVVDWCFNVGDWLRAITPNPQVELLGACTSAKLIRKEKWQSIQNYWWSPSKSAPAPPPCTILQEKLIRKVASTSKPVLPAMSSQILNFKRVADSLSIIWGRIPRQFKR